MSLFRRIGFTISKSQVLRSVITNNNFLRDFTSDARELCKRYVKKADRKGQVAQEPPKKQLLPSPEKVESLKAQKVPTKEEPAEREICKNLKIKPTKELSEIAGGEDCEVQAKKSCEEEARDFCRKQAEEICKNEGKGDAKDKVKEEVHAKEEGHAKEGHAKEEDHAKEDHVKEDHAKEDHAKNEAKIEDPAKKDRHDEDPCKKYLYPSEEHKEKEVKDPVELDCKYYEKLSKKIHGKPKTKDTKSKTKDSKSKTKDTKSQAKDTKSKAKDTKSKVKDTKSKTKDTKSIAKDSKSKAKESKSKVNDCKPKAKEGKSKEKSKKPKEEESKAKSKPKENEDCKSQLMELCKAMSRGPYIRPSDNLCNAISQESLESNEKHDKPIEKVEVKQKKSAEDKSETCKNVPDKKKSSKGSSKGSLKGVKKDCKPKKKTAENQSKPTKKAAKVESKPKKDQCKPKKDQSKPKNDESEVKKDESEAKKDESETKKDQSKKSAKDKSKKSSDDCSKICKPTKSSKDQSKPKEDASKKSAKAKSKKSTTDSKEGAAKCVKISPCKYQKPVEHEEKVRVESTSPTKKSSKPGHFFTDKVALITGGTDGIGLECAKELLRCGVAGCTIADLDQAKGEALCRNLTQEFGNDKAIFVRCDVMKSELVDWAFKNTIKKFDRVDIVINNAGILNDQKWEKQIATNMGGVVVGSLLALQYMNKSCFGQGGSVINMSSIVGITPLCGCPIHCMTQSGIIGFTRALGYGNHFDRTGVRVMALCPGPTNTKLLMDAADNCLNEKFSQELESELELLCVQDPVMVARALIKMLCQGTNGSVWISENCCPAYEIDCPEANEQ